MSESKIQLQRWVLPVLGGLVLLVLVGGMVYFYQAKKKPQFAPTQVKAMNDTNNTPVAGGPGTAKYNEELKKYEMEQSIKAAKEGSSRAAVVIGNVDSLSKEDVVKPVEPVDAPKANTATRQEAPKASSSRADREADRARVQQLNEMQKSVDGAIKGEMQMINTSLDKLFPEPTVLVFAAATQKEENAKQANIPSESNTTNQQKVIFTLFDVGDVLYAMNTIAINSDVPGPVMIELVSGRLRGGKFIGSFVRHNKFLLLKFNAFAYQGKTYPVDALAVDPATSGVAVRSDVDSHYIERWGGLIAASFLEGFSEAVSNSGTSTKTSDVSVSVTHPTYSTADQMWIAAGKVGEKLAEPMLENFYRPPTVYLAPGTEMGILIVKN